MIETASIELIILKVTTYSGETGNCRRDSVFRNVGGD